MVAAGDTANTAAAVQMAENSADLNELEPDLKGLAEMHSSVHFDKYSHVDSTNFTNCNTIAETFKRKPNINAT